MYFGSDSMDSNGGIGRESWGGSLEANKKEEWSSGDLGSSVFSVF
jgi:hypothetical protein